MVGHRALDFAGAAHRVGDAGEFCQHAVAGGLDDSAVMLADLRIDNFDEMRLEALVGAFLIRAHQARIPHDIGGEDRGETAGGSRVTIVRAALTPRAEFNLIRAERTNFMRRRSGFSRGGDAAAECNS